jgi:GDP-4-dehydro-6-deoxy-D-mannose reductase
VKILVTGADGFAGAWLVRALLAAKHAVVGTHRLGGTPSRLLTAAECAAIAWRPLELASSESVESVVAGRWDAVVHLAAVSSGTDARRDPGLAWEVNAAGTARLAESLARRRIEGEGDPLLLLASTAEVYGMGRGAPRLETDPLEPCSPYAASKLGAEVAALETGRRTGLRVIVARPFPHTGPGQDHRFVVPALAGRIRMAKRIGAPAIKTGSLEPVRDFLDVRDIADAYLALVERGAPGEAYNIASGSGVALRAVVERLEALVGWRVITEHEPGLARRADILHLVGDAEKLRAATGWSPGISLDQTLQDLLDAQTD